MSDCNGRSATGNAGRLSPIEALDTQERALALALMSANSDLAKAEEALSALDIPSIKRAAFHAGWAAKERDDAAAEDEDVADAADVAFLDWEKAAK